jgi:phosphatidylinositol alpha-1,6-mannosyltransferase
MKICFLVQTLDPKAGYGRYAADLVAGLRAIGHTVIVLKEKQDGLEGTAILGRGWKLFPAAWKTRRYVRECDIMQAIDGYPYGIIAALANIGLGKKLVINALGTYAVAGLYRWRTAQLLRWAYRRADRVVAISRYTQREVLKKVSLTNSQVIPCGIDLSKFGQRHEEGSAPFILSVGAVEERKGYDVSVAAFARIAREFPHLKYYIVGRKEMWYFEQIQALVAKENLQDRVVFLEGISDDALAGLYRRARLFVLASLNVEQFHFEGFGLVYLEAAAAGTPVVGTRDSGPEDAVDDGKNGILVPQGDIEATAQAMRTILSDESCWKPMSEAGYRWAQGHSIDELVRKYDSLYSTLT